MDDRALHGARRGQLRAHVPRRSYGAGPRVFARDEEFRLYLGLLALGSLVIGIQLLGEGIATGEEGVRHAVFQTVSIMTTTGFASTDFANSGRRWPQ